MTGFNQFGEYRAKLTAGNPNAVYGTDDISLNNMSQDRSNIQSQ